MQLYLDRNRFNLVLTAVLSNCRSLFVLRSFVYKIINLVIIYGPLRIEVIKGPHTLKTHSHENPSAMGGVCYFG